MRGEARKLPLQICCQLEPDRVQEATLEGVYERITSARRSLPEGLPVLPVFQRLEGLEA
jgi:hypothetical protein